MLSLVKYAGSCFQFINTPDRIRAGLVDDLLRRRKKMTVTVTKEKRPVLDSITSSLVDTLKKHTSLRKTSTVLTNAVSLLKWAVDQVVRGRKIASYDPDTRLIELFTMPVLDQIEVSKKGEKDEIKDTTTNDR